jgi:hypothetical protein
VTLLPSVREQLEQAATRHARPARTRRASRAWRPRVGPAALAFALVVALAVALAGALARTGPGVVHASQAPAQAGTMSARLTQIAYVQMSGLPPAVSVSSLGARPLPAAGGGYEIAVSFTPRVSFAGAQGGYSVSVRGPLGLASERAYTTPASGSRAGVNDVRSVGAAGGQRLRPGLYTGTVALTYAEHPALLEDSETVYRPLGSFHVRVP